MERHWALRMSWAPGIPPTSRGEQLSKRLLLLPKKLPKIPDNRPGRVTSVVVALSLAALLQQLLRLALALVLTDICDYSSSTYWRVVPVPHCSAALAALMVARPGRLGTAAEATAARATIAVKNCIFASIGLRVGCFG